MLLVGFAVFVVASYSESQKTVITPIKSGWNLLSINAWELQTQDSPIKYSDFMYGYLYDITTGEYNLILKNGQAVYPNNQHQAWISEDNQKYYIGASMWVYSEKEGNVITRWDSSVNIPPFSAYSFKKGWNFIWITPEFVGKSFNNLKGTCNIQKVVAWANGKWAGKSQEWFTFSDTNMNQELDDEMVGSGFVIKVLGDCNLGESIVTPPVLP